MRRHLRRCAIASSGRDSVRLVLHDLNLELKKAGITGRSGSMMDVTFIEALKLHEEQGPRTRPLKRTNPRKTCYLKSRGKPKIFDRNLEK